MTFVLRLLLIWATLAGALGVAHPSVLLSRVGQAPQDAAARLRADGDSEVCLAGRARFGDGRHLEQSPAPRDPGSDGRARGAVALSVARAGTSAIAERVPLEDVGRVDGRRVPWSPSRTRAVLMVFHI